MERLRTKFQKDSILRSVTPPTAIVELYNETNENYNLVSHIKLIFKYYIYISTEKRILKTDILIDDSIKIKKRKKKICLVTKYTKKR